IDTCCIDKQSSAELSEAINLMYWWYQNAQICYVYLNDVGDPFGPLAFQTPQTFDRPPRPSQTLLEPPDPQEVQFFNKDWVHIGNKQHLALTLACITGILSKVLTSGLARRCLSCTLSVRSKCLCKQPKKAHHNKYHTGVIQSPTKIMSWAAEWKTTCVEDQAYSLLGLFGVYMPMLYGEGKMAFQRLQLEIIQRLPCLQGFCLTIIVWEPSFI
ncbi:hypothetical protein PISMIDRAFT_101515, partial [Pisolithus microcarpus 441]